jgi:hypothetical protein
MGLPNLNRRMNHEGVVVAVYLDVNDDSDRD